MIIVELDGPDEPVALDFAEATRFATDEHNNLLIYCGSSGDMLLQVFSARVWRTAGAELEDDDD